VIAVTNATPLVALARAGHLGLLRALFDELYIADAVYREGTVAGEGKPGAEEVAKAAWLGIRKPVASATVEPMLLGLDAGEFETLLLARELEADWVLIDERLGRRVARAMGLRTKGTMGILLAAAQRGLVSGTEALSSAKHLASVGIRIDPGLIAWLEAQLCRLTIHD